uniref:Alpha-2-macroglobulin n=1 Tax=Spermophilus dauricus TaxID=99837 RepID=A0A8C9P8V3_SPEDA
SSSVPLYTMKGNQSPKPVLILLFLLLPRDTLATAKPQYVVLVPSQLYAGVPEKACIILNHLNETVTLNVNLEYGTQSRNLLTELVTDKNSFHCSPFPDKLPSLTAFITVLIDGTTQHFISRKPMHIMKAESLVFVQTDKPIYKPGQTVRFRIVSVDINFHPLNEMVSLISKNRIFQWQNFKLQRGLSQLSFPLSVEPILGLYKVMLVKESRKIIQHSFEVKEYVLPKFEVQVKMPKTIPFLDEEFEVSVCGLYTYGKPVPGLVTINVCRKHTQYHSTCHGKHSQNICEEFSQQADNKGCFTQLVKTKVFQLRQRGYDMRIQVEAMIREEATGLELTGYGSSEITNTLSKLKFTKVNSYYRLGLPFQGQVLLVDEKNQPIPNQNITASVNSLVSTFTTNEHGLADISFNTLSFTTVTYKQNTNCFDNWWLDEVHEQTQYTASLIFSPSRSYVQLELVAGTLTCGQTQEIQAQYILNEQTLKDEKELTFYYLVKARGSIAKSGIHVLSIEKENGKHFLIPLEPDIAPTAQILLYTILPNGEIIADTQKLEIENCFSFHPGLPASDTHLKVKATPFSLCALRAVDQSVLLMKPEDELSPQLVSTTSDLGLTKCSHGKTIFGCCNSTTDGFHSGLRSGLRSIPRLSSSMPMMTDSPTMQVKETVRKYFPETWIWDLVDLDLSGQRELALKTPDTITEWKASALCLSGTTGLGLSPTVSLQVFQPFFLELTLPYSVVRGETFTLKATVSNYLSHCIQVRVQLEISSAFLAIPAENNEESHCVCGDRQKTISWVVTPKSLGKVNFTATADALQSQETCGNEVTEFPTLVHKDTVIKSLIVEKHLFFFFFTFCFSFILLSYLLCFLVLPSLITVASQLSRDILGSAVHNLQNLLKMPYGCGEQNMVLFVPNIYVLNYLNETQQLTEKIKSKAISYLVSGYQRQLNYKHRDGSYSTFGEYDGTRQGNTWLTAFVLKSFSQAQSYIFVEKSHITDALTWLSQKQKENGCFLLSGSLLNNAIKGGVDDEVTLSAYITINHLSSLQHNVVRNALFCLETAWGSISETQGIHVYTKALLAYAFALAGKQARRSELLESLGREAVKEEDSMHWQRPGSPQEAKTLYQPRAPSAEVEMTSYVLLAYLTTQPTPSSEDLSVASRIVKWIIKQQNPFGGFASTQDTVVALQALSKYGAAIFTKSKKAVSVTVKSSNTFSEEFHVDDDNRLLLQEVMLPEIPEDYDTTVMGSGCVHLQTSLRYNVLPKKEGKDPFTLHVDPQPKNCDGVDAHRKFQIHINISYAGERPNSNMVIVDVKMISGFIPVKPSVKKLQEQPEIQRTEVSTNHVLIYLRKVRLHKTLFSFLVEQDMQVKNLKPATVKAYDYYETDEYTIEEYSVPCSAGTV